MSLRRHLVAPSVALALSLGTWLAAAPSRSPVLAAECGDGDTVLVNGSFEEPGMPPDTYALVEQDAVPGWHTTDMLGEIELWGDGFVGVPAAAGTTFAELNANSAGTLYQDLVTTPGATMTWTLQHRAREGVDVMRVLIGDATTADVLTDAGWDQVSSDLADGVDAWGTHTGSYVVPDGQICTRFAFRAVSSGAGADSYGNLLDAIAFEVTIPAPPTPTPRPEATTAAVTPPPTDTVGHDATRPGTDGSIAVLGVLALAASAATMVAARTRRPTRPD